MDSIINIAIIPGLPWTGTSSQAFLVDTNTNASTYQNDTLIGADVTTVFFGTARLSTTDWSFDSITGTITWNFTADTGVQIEVFYE